MIGICAEYDGDNDGMMVELGGNERHIYGICNVYRSLCMNVIGSEPNMIIASRDGNC